MFDTNGEFLGSKNHPRVQVFPKRMLQDHWKDRTGFRFPSGHKAVWAGSLGFHTWSFHCSQDELPSWIQCVAGHLEHCSPGMLTLFKNKLSWLVISSPSLRSDKCLRVQLLQRSEVIPHDTRPHYVTLPDCPVAKGPGRWGHSNRPD